ncbi:uncharacterized protein YbcV (DUF1398 family) [Dyadobacter jejuensis]|uniref:Uncharacterized protein YbcV (DUF1398 family) n=1 Tax=Dyadobacter jejuensis TaxID=1082580 RepID=A0A316ACB5_9BACT|nr:DUF1398 family protein [Dyadobacter jejuensis]PWJ54534.1 uncharacterized protein YbcV (DUF1398 family) [Dyadobacter jejuensis]
MEFIELTESLIESAEIKAKGLPFPEFVKELKALGIDNYEVRVDSGDTTYTSKNGDKLVVPGRTAVFEPTETFKVEAVRQAIQRNQQGLTSYSDFLQEIGQAGIHTYLADLVSMRVIYQGPNSEYEYEEMISEA